MRRCEPGTMTVGPIPEVTGCSASHAETKGATVAIDECDRGAERRGEDGASRRTSGVAGEISL
eukprot:CAMPEP_0180687220 /NCGR_PEP_ID=MMETSP1037_2-20121125/73350_1 /TAXON_ID=632150 /ORGANISM="Azadinium spinosum, Strain 3D9" /LENGTH=62 /DNA_ID=CAMNT_0022718017 /DNA_START=130 /DNA_END=318 /DNA_ORIENTATION=-